MHILFLTMLVLAFTATCYSQTSKPNFPPPSDPNLKESTKEDSKNDTRFGSPEAEMRSKMEIKEEKKKYDEHLARAKEVSELASQLWTSYQAGKTLSAEDQKRFERLEKLTKRIRNDAGGKNENDPELKDIPAGMDESLRKISDMAVELQKLVENTPRNVVSAAVIDQANQLLGVIQLVRGK